MLGDNKNAKTDKIQSDKKTSGNALGGVKN